MPAETQTVVLIAARNEADRIADTIAALSAALRGAKIIVADDASTDETQLIAERAGATVISRSAPLGKGGNMSAAAETVLEMASQPDPPVFLLCDGDLGSSAAGLSRLVDAVRGGECDLAVASFARRVGGGFGFALNYAHRSILRRCGADTSAPISGQRALNAATFRDVVPFARGYGMEIGMTIDAVRAGHVLREYEIDLAHRATGRTVGGFLHRARQLRDFARVDRSRRRPGRAE